MFIKKVVYFTKPGEKSRLNELVAKFADNESALALAISNEFSVEFAEAMTIANMWIEVYNKKKNNDGN